VACRHQLAHLEFGRLDLLASVLCKRSVDCELIAPASDERETVMEDAVQPPSDTELTIVERYRRAAQEDMDSVELLRLLKEIEKELRRRRRHC